MMNILFKKQFLKELFFISTLVSVLHLAALKYYLYWTIDWYDIVMHFLGGSTIGFLAAYIFFTSEYITSISNLKHNKTVLFLIIVGFTMVIGLSWEVWELFVQFSNVFTDKVDTIVDLVMDFVGAVAVYLYVNKKIK